MDCVDESTASPTSNIFVGMDGMEQGVIMERTASGTVKPWRPESIEVGEGIELVEDQPEPRTSASRRGALSQVEGEELFDDVIAGEAEPVDSGSEAEDDEDLTQEELQEIIDEEVEEIEEADPANFSWSNDYSAFAGVREEFNGPTGPTISGTSPLEIFTQIWDLPLLESIAIETNRYAWEYIAKAYEREAGLSTHSRVHDWVETSASELYRLFGVMIIMSMCLRGRIEEYWSDGIISMPKFRRLMSKNRYILLMRFLHFVDNRLLTEHGPERKLSKVKPVIDYANKKFKEVYSPCRNLSLDESLLLWKGHLSWIQCIRTKAARFGIKIYELCEATTGYVLNMMFYTGKDTTPTEPMSGFTNVASKTVLKVLGDYIGKGYTLFMDNFYNSVKLTRFLKRNKTDVVGTLNRRRVDTPTDIKELIEKNTAKGTVVSRHCGDVSVQSWKDVKLVTILSTYHKDDIVKGRRGGETFAKPAVVAEYNKYMGGVDLKDQKLSMYLIERKRGLKWYMKVFRRLLNVTILNSYIIYEKNIGQQQRKMTHRQFRYKLSQQLAERFGTDAQTRNREGNPCSRLNKYLDHFPEHSAVSGERTPKQDRFKRGRCVRCAAFKKPTKSNVLCSQCKVFLCVGQCWKEFHSLERL